MRLSVVKRYTYHDTGYINILLIHNDTVLVLVANEVYDRHSCLRHVLTYVHAVMFEYYMCAFDLTALLKHIHCPGVLGACVWFFMC